MPRDRRRDVALRVGRLGLRTTTVESFDRHLAVNVRAPFLVVQAYARRLREGAAAPEDRRRIVALTSDHVGFNLPYGTSKGALDRLIVGAAIELGDVRVSANLSTRARTTPAG